MAHNIDMTNGRANMAFLGERKDIWHGLGQPMDQILAALRVTLKREPTTSEISAEWMKAAGLAWQAVKVPLFAKVDGLSLKDSAGQPLRGVKLPQIAIVRNDNAHPLGIASEGYEPVQPAQLIEWFDRYVSVDSRFQFDTMGSLRNGEIIWAMATFKDDVTVAGDAHKARLLMTTSFDGSMATINKATLVRVVCNNTLDASLADGGKATIRTRHSTKFDAAKVARELAAVAEGFTHYKAMGEALANVEMSKAQIAEYFKTLLDIPFDAKADDISGRKRNSFDAMVGAYQATVREGTPAGTRWAALNAATRYVDHDKSVKGDKTEARVLSANFGSGASLKAKAVALLYADGEPTRLESSLAATTGNSGGSLLDQALAATSVAA